MCIKKEKKQHMEREIGEQHTSIYKPNINTMYVKWSQDQYTKE